MPKKKRTELIDIKVSEQKTGDDPKLAGRRHFTIDVLVLEKELFVAERLSDLGAVEPIQQILENELRRSVQRYIDGTNELLGQAAALARSDEQEGESPAEFLEEPSLEGAQDPPFTEQDRENRYDQGSLYSDRLL